MHATALKTDETNNVVSHDPEIARLIETLQVNARITNDEWVKSLTDRKIKELQFHDAHRDRAETEGQGLDSTATTENVQGAAQDTYEKFYGNKKYYNGVRRSREYVANWIATNSKNKIVLDYACGDGMNAIAAAKAGAKLAIGIDISPVSIENARKDAEKAGVADRTFFLQADCENTRLPDNTAEVVICSGMLHHLDLSYAFPELRRVMKPGGKLLGVEALDYNPAIKLYRMMTPDMRTDWEKAHILSHADLRFGKRFFDVKNVNYWHILGILTPHLPQSMAPVLEKLDKMVEKIPFLNWMAWIFTFELHKRPEA